MEVFSTMFRQNTTFLLESFKSILETKWKHRNCCKRFAREDTIPNMYCFLKTFNEMWTTWEKIIKGLMVLLAKGKKSK